MISDRSSLPYLLHHKILHLGITSATNTHSSAPVYTVCPHLIQIIRNVCSCVRTGKLPNIVVYTGLKVSTSDMMYSTLHCQKHGNIPDTFASS